MEGAGPLPLGARYSLSLVVFGFLLWIFLILAILLLRCSLHPLHLCGIVTCALVTLKLCACVFLGFGSTLYPAVHIPTRVTFSKLQDEAR